MNRAVSRYALLFIGPGHEIGGFAALGAEGPMWIVLIPRDFALAGGASYPQSAAVISLLAWGIVVKFHDRFPVMLDFFVAI